MTYRPSANEFKEAIHQQSITCAACGGKRIDHGYDGECYRLRRREKRVGQLEALR